MRGVRYLYDDMGKKTAVLIDLARNSALWEELLDVALAQSRATERTERGSTVRGRLQRTRG